MLRVKKSVCLIIGISISIINLVSQEKSIYANSYLDPFIVNPAFTGVEYYLQSHLSIEKQWVGFPGSPESYKFTYNSKIGNYGFYDPEGFVNKGPFQLKERIGLGAALFNDVEGPISKMSGILSCAYHIPQQKNSSLSFGLSVLFTNNALKRTMLDPDQPNDDFLLNGPANIYNANFGAGVLYKTNSFFTGFSIDKLLPLSITKTENLNKNQSFFSFAGYKFGKSNQMFNFEPSVEILYLNTSFLLMDYHTKLYFKRLNWVAISFSSTKELKLQFALNVYKMMYIGYNYRFAFTNIEAFNRASYQISLGFNLGLIGVEGIKEKK